MTGRQLIETIVTSTNLPDQTLDRELNALIQKAGASADSVTLDQLRDILANYLQDVLLEAKLDHEKNSTSTITG
jgi:hypothetical protein